MSFWGELMARKRIIKAFRAGTIYKTLGTEERKIFPKIHSIKTNDHSTEYVFTLPTGLNPDVIKKNFFAFQQVFGQNIKMEGEIKKFVLTVHNHKSSEKIPYNFEEILATIKSEGLVMPIVSGKDSNGKMHIYDATNNPNLLIFGQPGSGKSSILHVILTTLMQLYSPKEIHFYLADFKMSELNLYEGVKHVKSISYLVKDLKPALKNLKKELVTRGVVLKEFKVRHINSLPNEKKPPYIILCIDEFVMINDEDVMSDLLQVSSLGRAYGIYLILSMQRPSHKILSTDVRGVLSVRMGFRTVDLRNAMIGETPGSEKISKDEPGKFLLHLDELIELKSPYLNEEKTEKIISKYKINDWKNHNFIKSEELKVEKPKTLELSEKDVFADVD